MLQKRTAAFAGLLLVAVGVPSLGRSGSEMPLTAFPSEYSQWESVKSTVVGPSHKQFAQIGGFQHIYANPAAIRGYQSRTFEDGAVVVMEWRLLEESGGLLTEGRVRQVDVMARDASRFASNGGWKFTRFVPQSGSFAPLPDQDKCFACHSRLKKDGLVLSSKRTGGASGASRALPVP